MTKRHGNRLIELIDLPEWISKTIAATFSLVILSFTSLILFGVGMILVRVIWPNPSFTVDDSLIKLVDTLAWPLTAALGLFFALTAKSLREGARAVFQRVTAFKAGSYEVSFSAAGAKRLKQDLEQSLEEFGDQSRIEYTRSARTHRVRDALQAALREVCRVSSELQMPDKCGIRETNVLATVHMQDVVYEESLYQLVDYIPRGNGSGRRFSIRYGAIGICYRSGTNSYWNINDPKNTPESLITKWGMTSEEANHSKQSEFAMCLTLVDENNYTAGLFFMKADKISSVAKEDEPRAQAEALDRLLNNIEKDSRCKAEFLKLANTLSAVYKDVAPSGTFVRVYK